MKKGIDFTKKPFYGIFAQAAKILRIEGPNAHRMVSHGYHRGRRKMVQVVNKLVAERIAELKRDAELMASAAQVQTEVENGTL